MPTLQELTLAHSRRLSEVYRTRDIRLAEAQASRDLQLRALAAAVKAYQKYDDDMSAAREKQLATEAKAEAARTAALLTALDQRADELQDAQLARRSVDVDVVRNKRRMEDAAEAKYLAVLAGSHELPHAQRAKVLQDADRLRRQELDTARRTHDDALATSQQGYRASVDVAVLRERRDGRDAERAYLEAVRFGEAAARAAKTAADQTLLAALQILPDARAIVRAWQEQMSVIGKDTAEAETQEFARFRRELQDVKT